MSKPPPDSIEPIFSLAWNTSDYALVVSASIWVIVILVAVAVAVLVWRTATGGHSWKNFEIDQADFGIGKQKFSFKPNLTDKQVAYAIWVELSTRKIGLEIDFENDVIAEIYDSWHGFFTVTRELVKGIPVQKVRKDSTQRIISLSIDVLNTGLRPHLVSRQRLWHRFEVVI